MPFPSPAPTNVAALMPGGGTSRQALAPGGSPGPVMVNTTTTNTALVPGGSYMNGA